MSTLSGERWLPIPGFAGRYDVSDHGRIRSWVAHPQQLPHVMSPYPKGPQGHLAVNLLLQRKRVPSLVHRLVLLVFDGPCPPGMEVRHLDGDSTNNVLANLRYGTHSENELDKVRHGRHRNASKTHCDSGHLFDETNTFVQSSGGRGCRQCQNARRSRIYYAKRAEGHSAYCSRSRHAGCPGCVCSCHENEFA